MEGAAGTVMGTAFQSLVSSLSFRAHHLALREVKALFTTTQWKGTAQIKLL